MNEAVTRETPRDVLEKAERIPEPSHEELAFALGRLLVWMIDGKTLAMIGQRTLIVAAKLRPDLSNGATLEQIAKRRGNGKSQAHKLAVQFTRTFGIVGINDKKSLLAKRRYQRNWARAHPHSKRKVNEPHHLKIINLFCEWERWRGTQPLASTDAKAREQMRRDFEPVARFIAQIDGSL